MTLTRLVRRTAVVLGKTIIVVLIIVLVVIGVALAVVETGWAKNQIRRLIIRQANEYLTATLDIGRLEGSLVRGIQLGDIRLSRDGRTLVAIDDVSLSYSLRELIQNGTVIKRIRLARPRVVMSRTADGRWDLATLVRREARQQERTGPGRPIEIDSIEVYDGSVTLNAPLDFGATHAPTRYEALNVKGAFVYRPVTWRLTFDNVSFRGSDPALTMHHLGGALENGPAGFVFHDLRVETPRSAFTVSGPIRHGEGPTTLDLTVRADRFAFQEWAGVLHGLASINVNASFVTTLSGPVTALQTSLRLQSDAGSVGGAFVLDTSVPGWYGAGQVDVGRLNLAGWLNRGDRPSDITGHVTFDLALDLGHHFPRGSYTFAGPHVMFMDYAADDLRARGTITPTDVLIAGATARAYGANVTASSGSIGVDDPFRFRFEGTTTGIDLRRLPAPVPVPHVESKMTFDYDVNGQFAHPFITGHAVFARSEFLGTIVEPGTSGSINTRATPIEWSGDGEVRAVDIRRLGAGLEVAWMQEPRYAGLVSGRFRVEGSGTDRESLVLDASGRLARADLFRGEFTSAAVTLGIRGGTLRMSYDGSFAGIDPAFALDDRQFDATLSGTATVTATVRDLLARTPGAADYDIDGRVDLSASTIRGFRVDRAHVSGRFRDSAAELDRLEVVGPALEGHGAGRIAFTEEAPSDFGYDITRADPAQLKAAIGDGYAGQVATSGRLTGPYRALRLAGDASAENFSASGVSALTVSGHYDMTLQPDRAGLSAGAATGHLSFATVAGQKVESADAKLTLDGNRIAFDTRLMLGGGRTASATGVMHLEADRRALTIGSLELTLDHAPWQLAPSAAPPRLAWSDAGVSITPLELRLSTDASQRVGVGGTFGTDGNGELRLTATHVFLDTIGGALQQPARYGGVIDAQAIVRGSRERPIVAGQFTITNGRVNRFSYERLAGRVDYADDAFQIDARLDQGPSTWLTAKGSLPLALLAHSAPSRPIDVAIQSSAINLGLLEGLTNVVRTVNGVMTLDVRAVGTSADPHFTGTVEISNASFLVAASGSRYQNARATVRLSPDRLTVETLHVEDSSGLPLDLHGSLGTHELGVGDLEIDATARHFELLHNEFGRFEVDASLALRGRAEKPFVSGDITVSSGNLQVDAILERALFQPYPVAQTALPEMDAVAALNPWQRLGIDISLHVPQSLKLVGQNVQVSPGTPIGLGDINLRVGGDLSLYKDAGQPLSVTGSFDSVGGTYRFQGRQFDVDQASSINFRGDLNPDLYVTVTRVISGVLARVTITGSLSNPELQLTSTPPLETSNILSLIVFNASLNDLSAEQQQELAVRAGTLAAGFLATPLVSALQRALGLETLGIEPVGEFGTGPKVTVGQEIAPGLIARFSRQFGQEPYDEATIEYYLSRLFRIRATFSDAGTLIARSPFRRVERAGIDFLFFFSF